MPVIIFTSSTSSQELQEAYDLHVNCVLTKPYHASEYEKLLISMCHFWLTKVKLPKTG